MELHQIQVIEINKNSDERKEKQKRIAQEAKNDTQDKQEVESIKMRSKKENNISY